LIVVKMIQKSPQVYRLEGSLKLRIARHMPAEEARFEFAGDLMKRLAGKARQQTNPPRKPNPRHPQRAHPEGRRPTAAVIYNPP